MPHSRDWTVCEAKPADIDYVSEGDDEIRNTKRDIRQRLALEHIWGTSINDDGLHKDGSARIQSGTDAAKPVSPKLNQLYYATDTHKLYHCKTAGSWTDITAEIFSLASRKDDYADYTMKKLYPVGSIYISTVSTNPASLLGFGTWVTFGAGRVLVGLDPADADFDTVEEIGGTKTHTLTVAEMPAHTHNYERTELDSTSGSPEPNRGRGLSWQPTTSTGGGQAHNNLQPYIVIHMWKRTA